MNFHHNFQKQEKTKIIMTKLSSIFLILLLTIGVFAQEKNPDAPIRVTFLHVNDVYQFMPVDGGKRGGLARLLTLKRSRCRKSEHDLYNGRGYGFAFG